MISKMFLHHSAEKTDSAFLFLHGFLENGGVWLPWAEKMAPVGSMYIPDLPGHGNTPVWEAGEMFPHWAAHLMDIIGQHQSSDGLVHIIGHSMGGYLALEMALLYPRRIGKVVLLHSTPMADSPVQIERRKRQIELIRKGRKSLLIKSVGPSMFAPENRERLADMGRKLKAEADRCPAEGMIKTLEAIMNRSDYRELMSQKMQDVLLITGSDDPFMPADYYKTLLSEYPRMAHCHFTGCGHASFLEVPEASLEVVKQFLEK
jgi:pimeloyl-ACP methyl ester carboxylesterase